MLLFAVVKRGWGSSGFLAENTSRSVCHGDITLIVQDQFGKFLSLTKVPRTDSISVCYVSECDEQLLM